MTEMTSEERPVFWNRLFSISPIRILTAGVAIALLVAVGVMIWLMEPPMEDVAILVRTLAATSILSLALGFVLYRRGLTRSPSLTVTLLFTYVWAALLTLVNVLVMARLMFVSPHDLALALVLLLFAAIIAVAFGVFVAAGVTDSLRRLAETAEAVAEGNLSARAQVTGRDEVAQVADAFNDMASQLEQADARRQEVEQMRRDLVAWTSHDLRTPLTSIRALVEALHDGMVTDADMVQRYYRTIRTDVLALNRLIDDLFELAQLEAGGVELELASHRLAEVIADVLDRFRAMAKEREVALKDTIGDDVGTVVMSADKIDRVLANLVGNALVHTPSGGEVQLEARRTAEGVEVTVQDSGPGFAKADLPRIFEQFYRGEAARTRATGGAGLGLAIAHGLVEAHGGRIWAENPEGGGALVGFLLPE